MSSLQAVMKRYFAMHGPLLAKGLSFTALFAAVPLLFLLTLAGSMVLTEEVLAILEGQFLMGLPEAYRQSVMLSLQRFADRPGSLTVATVTVFLYSVHTLFFDVHRVVRAGLGIAVTPGRGRLRAVVLNAVFLLLIYVTALATIGAQVGAAYLGVPDTLLEVLARISAVLIMAITLGSIVRFSGGRPISLRTLIPVFLTAGIAWQGATFVSGYLVRSAGRRMVVYGVLASAVLFLLLMRIFAEILLHSALWVHELETGRRKRNEESLASPE
jgi:uncharacterized BrkB/YihY/UPF0761 family membrane protein